MTIKKAVEQLHGDAFAVTSIGVAVAVGDGSYKAYDAEKKQIRSSRTVLPIDNSFFVQQTPVVEEGDFIEVGGRFMQVVLAGETSLGVVDPLSGEQKTVIKEEAVDGVKFVSVIKSAIPQSVIDKLISGKMTTEQMLLVSGVKSLDQILAMKLVADTDDVSADALAMFMQSRR